MIEAAKKWGAAVRIGVNGGSLDQALLGRLMDENLKSGGLLTPQAVLRKALVESAVQSAAAAEALGLPGASSGAYRSRDRKQGDRRLNGRSLRPA